MAPALRRSSPSLPAVHAASGMESKLEPIERAHRVYAELEVALSQHRREKTLPVAREMLVRAANLEAEVLSGLTELHQRALNEAWPSGSKPVKLMQKVEAQRAVLRSRLGRLASAQSTLEHAGAASFLEALHGAETSALSEPPLTLPDPVLQTLGVASIGAALLVLFLWSRPGLLSALEVPLALIALAPLLVRVTRGRRWLGMDLRSRRLVLWRGLMKPRRASRVFIPEGSRLLLRPLKKRFWPGNNATLLVARPGQRFPEKVTDLHDSARDTLAAWADCLGGVLDVEEA